MSTPHAVAPAAELPAVTPETARADSVDRKPVWAAVAIAAMWIAVLVDGIYGDDMVLRGSGTGGMTSVPSAVAVAFFACIATIFVARYGFVSGAARDTGR
jgi:hypothetical protein